MAHFSDLLADRCDALASIACVGLDPVLEQLPAAIRATHHDPVAAIRAFCLGIIDAVAPTVPVIKPQSACFERFGSRGVAVLEECCRAARDAGLLVLLDVKRGDIGISAEHYAAAAQHCGAHALTVSGYMGPDTIEPFANSGLGVFVLVRTSNPGSDAVQSQRLADNRSIAELLADHVRELGAPRRGSRSLSNIGAVVGATKAADAAALRQRMPDQVFLVPGFGAQGGTASDITHMVRANSKNSAGLSGVLVNASRSVIYAKGPAGANESDWKSHVAAAATALNADLAPVWN
jgi:orotidine-5'-phosphate decarboxylase